MEMMDTFLSLIEIKDKYTAGHSKNVTYYTKKIAEKLNEEYKFHLDMNRIEMAAALHDIGKIGIDANILNKPGRLTDEEYEVVKTHPCKGYYALRNVEELKEEREVVKHHHERYDGHGYPDGIKGEDIPIGARIVNIADSFDAMISDRPYRKSLGLEKAVEELIVNKGSQFDPFIVDVFLSIVQEGEIAL